MGAVPSTFAPSRNVTLPVGEAAASVAVKVRLCPNTLGSAELASAIAVSWMNDAITEHGAVIGPVV